MKKALHVKSIYRSNIISDIRIAREAGYDAIEAVGTKILTYLESGNTIEYLKETLKKYNMKIISVNDIANVERVEKDSVEKMCKEAHILSNFCKEVGCNTIQLVPLCAHEGKPWEEVLKLTSSSVTKVLNIGKEYGVRFQLEPVAWSPINSLSKALELIKYTGCDNFGMVIDFWHLWYGQGTTPNDVANLDKNLIYNIHFCDGIRNAKGTICDEEVLRGVYAGEGEIDIPEWVNAVKKTGYDGYWSYELISKKHWEHDTKEVAEKTKALLDKYLG